MERWFNLASFIMGCFAMLIIAGSIIFAFNSTFDSLGVIFLFIFLLSYIIPFVLNITRLRMFDFVKGVLYATYLGPTYANIMTIYSICNIHDVSWGNRPTQQNAIFAKIENKKGILYRDYRANFLIIWALINIAVAAGLVNLSRRGDVFVIFLLGVFLVCIMIFRIVLSTLHIFKSHYENFRVNRYIKTKGSHVFDDVSTKLPQEKEDVFEVYYDDEGNDFRVQKDNPLLQKFLGGLMNQSAIKSQDMYRGFNLGRLVEEQNIARTGTNIIAHKKTLNFKNLAKILAGEEKKELDEKKEFEEKPSDDDVDDKTEEAKNAYFSPVESPSPALKRRKMGLDGGLASIERSYTRNQTDLKRAMTKRMQINEVLGIGAKAKTDVNASKASDAKESEYSEYEDEESEEGEESDEGQESEQESDEGDGDTGSEKLYTENSDNSGGK